MLPKDPPNGKNKTKNMTLRVHSSKMATLLLLLAAGLLTGCGGSDDFEEDTPTPNPLAKSNVEIGLNADIWRMMDGSTRATTYDNQAALQTLGTFKSAVYVADGTTAYISPTDVTWNSTSSVWEFSDGKHYWPMSESLDFFAYMPVEKPSYVTTGPTYAVDAPYFVCTGLPISITQGSDGTKEFLMAYTPGQNKSSQGSTGVTMNFLHPFARVCFKLSSASGTAVKVNSITIAGNTYRNGTCTLNDDGAGSQTFTWSSRSNTGSFVVSKGSSDGAVATGDDYFLVIPNNYGSKTLTVNATWSEWGNAVMADVSASVAFNWAAGTSYTYTLTLSKYALKVDTSSKFTEQW